MEKIEFVKLIRTRPGGGEYIECQYRIFFEKEIVLLHLQIVKEGLIEDFPEIREPSPTDTKDNFIMNKEDQEEFFKGKGNNNKDVNYDEGNRRNKKTRMWSNSFMF